MANIRTKAFEADLCLQSRQETPLFADRRSDGFQLVRRRIPQERVGERDALGGA
jgi:hypothetical protein